MKNVGIIALIVIAVLVGAVYIGGTVHVGGKTPFEYMDQALGTDFFMGCYATLANVLERRESTKEDEWTKSYQDWDKVLKSTSE